jgi:hypothetical protein
VCPAVAWFATWGEICFVIVVNTDPEILQFRALDDMADHKRSSICAAPSAAPAVSLQHIAAGLV